MLLILWENRSRFKKKSKQKKNTIPLIRQKKLPLNFSFNYQSKVTLMVGLRLDLRDKFVIQPYCRGQGGDYEKYRDKSIFIPIFINILSIYYIIYGVIKIFKNVS